MYANVMLFYKINNNNDCHKRPAEILIFEVSGGWL